MPGMDTTTPRVPGKKRVQLYLPPALHRRLKIHAVRNDTSASRLAEEFIRAGLERAKGATT